MSAPAAPRRLRILTWHVHGNYLHYLSQVPHELFLVTGGDAPGRVGHLSWGANLHEVPAAQVRERTFDVVLYQARRHYDHDRHAWLSPAQRALPHIVLEHDPPQQHPTDTRHWAEAPALLVHVTHFNALMWDSGSLMTRVIEHGVPVPGPTWDGALGRGVVVVNQLARRGRRLGADLVARVGRELPLDLYGMEAGCAGGLGEIPNPALAARLARYRFFFHPARYTSLGLALLEAMALGMPVVALATTEVAGLIRNGENGYADTRLERLVEVMRSLLADHALARAWGEAARLTAQARFGLPRFVADWNAALRAVLAAPEQVREEAPGPAWAGIVHGVDGADGVDRARDACSSQRTR